ncbi:MAG TPA: PAC2 family protein [Anaerohalosphaeraceae bacterium]|nr:PAC2 family protein [Anaerohalosphaeraceae bacterium]
MSVERLRIYHNPDLTAPTLVLGFDGWMDGGEVSTGLVDYLRVTLGAVPFASIDPEPFYVFQMPGTMEVAGVFRPHVKIDEGLIEDFSFPNNTFFAEPRHNLILFSGKEPNLRWECFADCIFHLCERFDVKQIFFVGSVAGLTPHSREPKFTASVSQPALRAKMQRIGIRLSRYEGPAGFATYLTWRASKADLDMFVLVAEIPAYLQGYNPRAVEAAVRCISGLLELHLTCEDLRTLSDEFERKVGELVQQQPELAARIQQLEEIYDNEIFDTELSDLKNWLHQRGIRLD